MCLEGAGAAAGDGGGEATMMFVMVDARGQRADCRSSVKAPSLTPLLHLSAAASLALHRTTDTSNTRVHFIYFRIHTQLLSPLLLFLRRSSITT